MGPIDGWSLHTFTTPCLAFGVVTVGNPKTLHTRGTLAHNNEGKRKNFSDSQMWDYKVFIEEGRPILPTRDLDMISLFPHELIICQSLVAWFLLFDWLHVNLLSFVYDMPINNYARFKITYLNLGNFVGKWYTSKISWLENQLSLLGWMTLG